MSVVSEVKQRSERSHIFRLNSSEVKHRSERSRGNHFNSSESKNTVVRVVRYFILVVVK